MNTEKFDQYINGINNSKCYIYGAGIWGHCITRYIFEKKPDIIIENILVTQKNR